MSETKNFFSRWAKGYDHSWLSARLKKTQRQTIEKIPGEIFGKTILDLGTGTGNLLIYLAPKKPQKLVGLDVSPEMIKQAKEKTKDIPSVELAVADAEKIPYPDNYFDYVICNNVFHHIVKDKAKNVFWEIKRVLKKDGWFLLQDLLPPVPIKNLISFVMKIFEGPIHIYNFHELEELFSKSNFDNIKQYKLSLLFQLTMGQKV